MRDNVSFKGLGVEVSLVLDGSTSSENRRDGIGYPEKGGIIFPNPQGSEGGEMVGIPRAQGSHH